MITEVFVQKCVKNMAGVLTCRPTFQPPTPPPKLKGFNYHCAYGYKTPQIKLILTDKTVRI